MTTYTATYSPDDNKLRLYASSRLDAETYARVKEAGFKWAPKQELFVAPMWTPGRADLLVDFAGQIEDEDKSLVDRAEERAERFDDYSDNRKEDAERARQAVASIADNIPFGQPILIGHHSERRASKDAERIENGMRKAVKMWEQSKYWKDRAAGALAHAKYKELTAVRARRIKGIEADKRKRERQVEEAERFNAMWSKDGLTYDRALMIANHDHVSKCFTLAEFPRELPASQYEGMMSLWSALTDHIINEHQAAEIALRVHARTIAYARRWIEHYEFRIEYERAMLGEAGGLVGEQVEMQPGGMVSVSGSWFTIIRVNKKAGNVCSVRTNRHFCSLVGVEEIRDYKAPSVEDAARVKAVTKLPPLTNFPTDGCLEMTAEEYKKKHADYKHVRIAKSTAEHGAYRYRVAFVQGCKLTPVFLTDAKRVDPPKPESAEPVEPLPSVPAAPRFVERPAEDPQAAQFDALRDTLKTGVKVISAHQLFPTPSTLASRMVEIADIRPGMRVLEPSAGTGRILDAIGEHAGDVVAVEINAELGGRLNADRRAVVIGDFLECSVDALSGSFDRILMNPPFEHGVDIRHILHARKMLNPGGRLVAICANGPRQRETLAPIAADWESLPAGTFAESGTNVNAALVTINA